MSWLSHRFGCPDLPLVLAPFLIVLSFPSCPGVYSWQSCPGSLFLEFLSWQSCPGSPVLAVPLAGLSWQSPWQACSGSPPGRPVLTVLSWQSGPGSPGLAAVLACRPSWLGGPGLAVLSWRFCPPSCPGGPVSAILSWQTCPGPVVFSVLFFLSLSGCLFWLSCPGYTLLSRLPWQFQSIPIVAALSTVQSVGAGVWMCGGEGVCVCVCVLVRACACVRGFRVSRVPFVNNSREIRTRRNVRPFRQNYARFDVTEIL